MPEKKKDAAVMADIKDKIALIWSWIVWPFDVLKLWWTNATRWIYSTAVWKKLEAMEYDPPPFPLTWWLTRGGVILIILLTTHWWSYNEGKTYSAFADSAMLFSQPHERPDMSEVNYLRRLAAERTKSMKSWMKIAKRLDADNKILHARIEMMRLDMANLKSKAYHKALAQPPKKSAVKVYKKKKKKVVAKPAPSAWLSP